MLHVLYLAGIFRWEGGSWKFLCCGCFQRCGCPCLLELPEEEPDDDTDGTWLRRGLIKSMFTPSAILRSVVADIDLVADWYFWQSDSIQDSKYDGIALAALVFTVLGTITWLLLATDGLGWLRVRACRGGFCGSAHRYWSLVNTLVEDLPQLVITLITTGFYTVPGALNIATAIFGFLAKIADSYSGRKDDLPTEFEAIADNTTRPLVRERLDLEAKVTAFKKATELIGTVNDYPERTRSMAKAISVARNYGTLARFVVKLHHLELTEACIKGKSDPTATTIVHGGLIQFEGIGHRAIHPRHKNVGHHKSVLTH